MSAGQIPAILRIFVKFAKIRLCEMFYYGRLATMCVGENFSRKVLSTRLLPGLGRFIKNTTAWGKVFLY